MQKEIYEKNLEVLRKKYPVWAEKMEKLFEKNEDGLEITSEQSISGETIFAVTKDGKKYYLGGKYAPEKMVDYWLEKNAECSEFSTVFVIGIHNGVHIKKMREVLPAKVNYIIYEPSLAIFRHAFENVDLSFLFKEDIPVGVVVEGMNEFELQRYFNVMINFDNMTLLKVYISGNYEHLFAELIDEKIKLIHTHVNKVKINWNTIVRYTNVNAKNVFSNIKYLYKYSTINSLHHILPADMPTIVVSAGPSLNKNIMELKKAQGRACIIATDTAMKPLLNAGIRPDLFVVVDGLKPGTLFQHENISKVPMVTFMVVAEEPMRIHRGKKFFAASGSPLEYKLADELGKNGYSDKWIASIPTGGSVANNCFTMGMYMGSRTIILVGQDLAMTGNRTHADGTFQDKMDEIDIKSKQYFEVEANDGGKVLTRADFNNYRKWFEEKIEEWPHVRVINATEGGAKIKGAEVMTLAEAIEKTCHVEKNLNWKISHAKRYLESDEEREVALEYFLSIPEKILEVRKKAEDGIKQYEKLLKLSEKKKYSSVQLQKLLKKISKVNQYMETDYMALMMSDSLKGLEYNLRATIFETKSEEKDEIRDIARHGLVMLRAIVNVSVQFEKLAENTVVKFAKKQKKLMEKKK